MSVIKQLIERSTLPPDELVICGGGILDALGLRKANDLDAIASPRLFEELQASGRYGCGRVDKDDYCRTDEIEIWRTYFGATYDEVVQTAVVIDGLRYASIDQTIKWKRQLGREKDLADIKLLEEYLERTR